MLIFGQYDGIVFKQDVRRELCGIALKTYERKVSLDFRETAKDEAGHDTGFKVS